MTYQLRNVVIAIVLGVLAAVLVTVYVANYRKHVQQGAQNVDVLIAATDIPAGTSGAAIVAGHMLKQLTVPRTALTPGAISNPDQIVRLVSTDQIMSGEQISTRRFGNSAELGVRAKLKGTMRAIQISANPNQVLAGTLRVGDRVDLIANLKNETGGNTSHYDRIVIRNLLVLRAPAAVDLKSGNIGNSQQESVMLAMTDTQSPKFYWAIKNADQSASSDGGWALALRPVGTAADGPTVVESFKTVLLDGVSASERTRIGINGG
jgi:pilus assembly protein CpaB